MGQRLKTDPPVVSRSGNGDFRGSRQAKQVMMGKFDEIRCDAALPDARPTEGIIFETRSFPLPSMQRYVITKSGRLLDVLGRDLEPDGYVTFHTMTAVSPHATCRQYGARFLNGQLLKIVFVEGNPFETGNYTLASFRWCDDPTTPFGEGPAYRKPGFIDALDSLVTPSGGHGMYSDQQRTDARNLALHCFVARKLLVNHALIDQARDVLGRWKLPPDKPMGSYIDEWERILGTSVEEVAGFLASITEDAARLRRLSPFRFFVTPEERSRIYRAFM